MIARVIARSSAALRCAVCHDDLAPRHWTCPGCNTALHGECMRRLTGCPTLGCTHRVTCSTRPTPSQKAPASRLEALVFWVPAVLTFLWPLTFLAGVLLRDALGLAGSVFIGPSLDYMLPILILAVGLGPAVGHLVLAPLSGSLSGVAGQHRRATGGSLIGLGFSVLTLLVIAAMSA